MDNLINLSPLIIKDLRESGLSDDTILAMEIEEIKGGKEGASRLKEILGYSNFAEQGILQVTEWRYAIPYMHHNGFGRIKLNVAIDGAKYLSPRGAGLHLYFLPETQPRLSRAVFKLLIAEGEKKAAKLTQDAGEDYAVVGFPGAAGFQGFPEWKDIRLSKREIIIFFDGDIKTNPDVAHQLLSLYMFLLKRNASTKIATWEGEKGIDDFLVAQEAKGKNPKKEIERLIEEAESNPFDLFSLSVKIVADCMAVNSLSKPEAKVFYDKFNLKKLYSVNFSSLYALVTQHHKNKKKDKDTRPKIVVAGGELPGMVDEAERVLLQDKTVQIYQKSGLLIRVVANAKAPLSVLRDIGAISTKLVEPNWLIDIFTKLAHWQKFDARSEALKTVDCPKAVADIYLARQEWKVPVLTGIIGAPTLRPDGSILDKPGYDVETGLLFWPRKTKFLSVPENPTWADAIKALDIYLDLFRDFPFCNDANRSVAISACLTGLIRHSIRTAPLHCFSAPKRRSGKTLLADIPALIATGKNTAKLSLSKNTEEMEKRLFAVLLQGNTFNCIDNIEFALESEALNTILTENNWSSRVLGESKIIDISTMANWSATGNNLSLKGDLVSRAILGNLDPECERPEARKFEINLLGGKYIQEHRAELVNVGLTMLRAYHVAGRPRQDFELWGGFDDWSDWVRSALVWLGAEDPCKSREKIEDNDPAREQLVELLAAWHDCFGDVFLTIKEIKKQIEDSVPAKERLKEAIMAIAGKNDTINSSRLGYFFRKHKDKIESGHKLVCGGKTKKGCIWQVVKKGDDV